jgi:hypothetical protein
MQQRVANKRVKFVMDSQPAIANLTKGGGKKDDINEEIKRWWKVCETYRIEASYEWVARTENSEADELSKRNEIDQREENMTDTAKARATAFIQRHGIDAFETPKFNAISNR